MKNPLSTQKFKLQESSVWPLQGKFSGRDDFRGIGELNKARTDIRNFLTQRALQSFIFLLSHCRDTATVRWLETKFDFKNLESFHGTGAFNLTKYPEWDSMLLELMFTPPQVVIISAKRRGRGHGGWSKDNPFLEERFVDFEIDIDPPSLVQRIVSVRDQIANEWVSDLETLVQANEMILESYHKFQSTKRLKEASKNMKSEDVDEWSDNITDVTCLTAPYSSPYDKSFKAYDRSAMLILGNNIIQDGRASSSFRKGNFDLLGLLATQESIHRVLRKYKDEATTSGELNVSFEWLKQFYVSRVPTHFDGNQEYGRADDFLEELLITAPSLKITNGKLLGFIDPMRMAEDIIATRSQVAHDWRDLIINVPSKDHAELRSMCLSIRMGKTIERSPSVEEPIRVDEGGFQ